MIFSAATVVICFVLATLLGEYRTRIGGDPAGEIASSISPRIENLASLADRLRQLDAVLGKGAITSTAHPAEADAETKTLWQEVGPNIQSYLASASTHLPIEEREAFATVHRELETAMLKVVSAPAADASPARPLSERLKTQIDQEERELEHAIRAEARYASIEAHRISEARRRRVLLVVTLDAVSVLMAIVLTWLALRAALAQQRLQRSRAEELELFAARVAHDIVNPISAAEFSAVAALRRPDDLPRAQQALRRVNRSLERARCITSALFEFARSGARPGADALTPLRKGVKEAIEEVEEDAKTNRIEIAIESVPDAAVACSAGALASVLGNLLRNAIKYMGNSSVRKICIRARRSRRMVRIEIEDTGPGFPAALGTSLFEPFVRGEHASGIGFGLGLATVRRLVDAHGGAVGVEAGAAGGGKVWFELPVATLVLRPAPRSADSHHREALRTSAEGDAQGEIFPDP